MGRYGDQAGGQHTEALVTADIWTQFKIYRLSLLGLLCKCPRVMRLLCVICTNMDGRGGGGAAAAAIAAPGALAHVKDIQLTPS
eukprot:6291610-Amphidinium_carterae.1